ncbi:ATP-grasp domain-containing protein [Butyrivibrio sp. WCD3002]|uniref:ATP-grasp domain-containing protein n=1 Tax=Butyrivibrio sp. WCD3002 TaxID=1280676 RepID=UPI0004062C5D|nr:ATP-grasp domain-containing protein [Butyrivibrio sp. WCD3002]
MSIYENKKLLILGGNYETMQLVECANNLGIKTIVTSNIEDEPSKKIAWKAAGVDGMDVPGLIAFANEEKVDGILVGVADTLVPAYCRVCDALKLPCYATQEIVDVFAYKDVFKTTCEEYGIHGIPEYYLDESFKREDLDRIKYPVMVKPVDSSSGKGIVKVESEAELKSAVETALSFSKSKRFIVEQYMDCDDMGIYYTFVDGYCSASCVYDRYACTEQEGVSRVCLGGTYPSKHIDEYYSRMHDNAVRMFRGIGIRNGVLMLSAFYKNGEFYVYDTGFRLQGEAPHLLLKAIHGYDQRRMLIDFAMTGKMGDIDLKAVDDSRYGGKWAATLWLLLKEGTIGKIKGLPGTDDKTVVHIGKRFSEGDVVLHEWIGTERQVLARIYFVCESKEELAEKLKFYQNSVKVTDINGNNMLLKGFDVDKALEIND